MKHLQEILIAFSLSNLLFVREWKRLLYPTNELYHVKLTPYSTEYLGVILNVLLVGILFLVGLFGIRYFFEKVPIVIKLLFLLMVGIAFNGLRHQLYEIYPNSYIFLIIIVLVTILTTGIFSFLKWENYYFILARWICLVLSLLLFITLPLAILGIFSPHQQPDTPIENQLSSIRPKDKPIIKSRVVWIIFDELDYSIAFEKLPPQIVLYEFEKLKQQALFAVNAAPPASTTRDAMASLITGKRVEKSEAISSNDLLLKFTESENEKKFSETPNIFAKIKELSGETALVGWVHPYCRVLGKDLSACQWDSFDIVNDIEPLSLGAIMRRNWQNVFISMPFGSRLSQFIGSESEEKGYLKRHNEMINAANAIITNPNINLALIHLPFPHPPNYYNRQTGEFSSAKKNDYFDNLILTDKILGEIRKNLEVNNLWDESTIIISSDHQWRVNVYKNELSEKELAITNGKEDPRIPFILKLKGQKESIIYDKPFNTVITSDLILALVKGEITTAETAENWLDKNAK